MKFIVRQFVINKNIGISFDLSNQNQLIRLSAGRSKKK